MILHPLNLIICIIKLRFDLHFLCSLYFQLIFMHSFHVFHQDHQITDLLILGVSKIMIFFLLLIVLTLSFLFMLRFSNEGLTCKLNFAAQV
jgi:hypothetical protein